MGVCLLVINYYMSNNLTARAASDLGMEGGANQCNGWVLRCLPPGPSNKSSGQGRGGYKCLYGEALPRGPTPYPFINHFSQKGYPFGIPSFDKWYPFHIPCLELCIPFNGCKCTIFYIGIYHKNRTFSWLFKAHKIHLLALVGPFTDPNGRFP